MSAGIHELQMMLVKLPGAGLVKTCATAVTVLTLSAYEGKTLTFQCSGGTVWWAAGPDTTHTVATASSMPMLDGQRWDALITRDRIVLKLKGGASRRLKYAVTG